MIPRIYEKYEKVVGVSVVNFNPVWDDKVACLEKMKTMVAQASGMGSGIVVFPEGALGGYECTEESWRDLKPCSHHDRVAETIPGPSTKAMAELAADLGVYVLFGMAERDAADPKVRYNSIAVVGPEGILGRHRKIRLGRLPVWPEDICFRPGRELATFETKFGPIGIQICVEFFRCPEQSKILCLKGARLLFNCTAAPSGPKLGEGLRMTTAVRARENNVFVASANLVGKERTESYYGHSCIAGPAFPAGTKVYAECGDNEEIISATLNFQQLHYQDAYEDTPAKMQRFPELIADEFGRLAARPTRSPRRVVKS